MDAGDGAMALSAAVSPRVQRSIQLDFPVKVVLKRFLATGGNDDDVPDAGVHELVHNKLDGRDRNEGEHFFRDGFGNR